MKKFLLATILLSILASCTFPAYKREVEKAARSKGASERINNSEKNSEDVFKDLY